MLVDKQGTRLDAIRKADHWRLFEALLQNTALATPLRSAVDSCISASVSEHSPGEPLVIDSSATGPRVFVRLGAQWPSDYAKWHAAASARQPKCQDVTAERMYGMMLWYVLAADRGERWLAPPQGGKRAYTLLADRASGAPVSAERRVLIELRQALRAQLAKLDAALGDIN
jgi:hypothetical protein